MTLDLHPLMFLHFLLYREAYLSILLLSMEDPKQCNHLTRASQPASHSASHDPLTLLLLRLYRIREKERRPLPPPKENSHHTLPKST